MPTTLTAEAIEGSTFVVTVSFYDEAGDACTPNAGLTWSLTDRRGNVINSRSAVSISPSDSVTIVLSGADLPMTFDSYLVLKISGTYDSSAGQSLPLKDEISFKVNDLIGVV